GRTVRARLWIRRLEVRALPRQPQKRRGLRLAAVRWRTAPWGPLRAPVDRDRGPRDRQGSRAPAFRPRRGEPSDEDTDRVAPDLVFPPRGQRPSQFHVGEPLAQCMKMREGVVDGTVAEL